jgi:hypothetical protein
MEGIHAQNGLPGESAVPLKPQSPLFGKDIVMCDSSSQNQHNVVISSAYNGWLYAAYEFYTPKYGGREALKIMKSIDNGITWNVIIWVPTGSIASFSSFCIAVTGDSVSNIKVFLAWVSPSGPIGNDGGGEVWRFDGNGNFIDGIDLNASYIALASDFMFPASNSNPCSVGVLYASNRNTIYNKDTLILLSSSNGGASYDNRQLIALNSNHFHNVALTYGRSPSWSTGRYFATWVETSGYTTYTGHVYTAHSNPDFNSPFTQPICIDSLDQSAINKCRNPKIACQFSSSDNDSSNLTEVIMLEKQLSSNSYDTRGFYNLQATTSSHFNEFSLSSSQNNKTQPDINFNPYDSVFMLTYYDSTLQSLPFLTNDVNLANPGTWNIITPAYNDSPNLAAPYPKVVLDILQQQGADVWAAEGTGGNGIAMFDAQYSTYTGISVNSTIDDSQSFRVYPNPCNSSLTIAFSLKRTETVKITLYNQIGETMGVVTDRLYSDGQNTVNYDVSNLSSGGYFLTFIGGNIVQTRKLFIVR